ncbi:MAG: hypothetical protein HY000_31725 [Planctomycetes bacterium]|nr:hypothetical protein [Planctomycetota bacterium]
MTESNDPNSEDFPTTRKSVLQEAASDRWERFWQIYLKPCLREITLQIRQNPKLCGVEPEEVLNEFYLALRRPGKFSHENRKLLQKAGFPADKSSNVPARFLMRQKILGELDEQGLPNARFRTLLKSILKHMLVDLLRRRGRTVPLSNLADEESDGALEAVLPVVETSVDQFIDRDWARHQIAKALHTLVARSQRATTKGRRRHARLLYLKHCKGLSDSEIASHEAIARTTIVEQVAEAHADLQQILTEQCGKEETENLQAVLASGNADLLPQLLSEHFDRSAESRATWSTRGSTASDRRDE